MFKSYFIMAFRNFLKHRLFSAINIFGLAFGLASCLLILLFVQNELSYDKWIPGADNIYRVHSQFEYSGRPPTDFVLTPGPVGGAILRDIPEVEEAARVLTQIRTLKVQDKVFSETVWYTDESFFKIFELPFVEGNIKTALSGNNNIIISEDMARKYFKDKPALDQVINFNGTKDYRIVGILKNLPDNTHFDVDFLVKLDPQEFVTRPWMLEYWTNVSGYLYLKLKKGIAPETIESRFPAMITENKGSTTTDFKGKADFSLTLQELTDLHLHASGLGNFKPQGNINTIYGFIAIALLILIIACINFMNLSTARSSQRAREVALRKVVGASRKQLITQFMIEALLMSVVALLLALGMTELVLPWLNEFTNTQLALNYFIDPTLFASLFGLVVAVAIVGGLYPAFYISSLRPAMVLKANQSSQASGSNKLRSFLVIFQFSISIALVICTAVVYGQIQFMQTMDRGFSKDNKLILAGVAGEPVAANKQTLAQEIKRLSSVEGVSFSSQVPGNTRLFRATVRIPGQQSDEPIIIGRLGIDHEYLNTYDINMLAGRGFSRDRGQDQLIVPDDSEAPLTKSSIIINEGAVRQLGFNDPEQALGQTIMLDVRQGENSENEMEVIGVIPDVNFRSLKDDIRPMIYVNNPSDYFNLTISYKRGSDPQKLVQDVENIWKKFAPDTPANHQFLDDFMGRFYADDQRTGTMFAAFSALAIIVACLGLYGLAAFTAELRTKEIGLRKVMGASVMDIVKLLVWQFSKPVIIANLIAWPVAFYVAQDYLNGFQYRIDLSPSYFIIAGFMALTIAWATVTWHSVKVAAAKPIEALRCE